MLPLDAQVGAGASQQVEDPYANEPKRHPALVVRSMQPFNAETPVDVLGTSPRTPNELFYVRNHLPVPHVDPSTWSVRLHCTCCSAMQTSARCIIPGAEPSSDVLNCIKSACASYQSDALMRDVASGQNRG